MRQLQEEAVKSRQSEQRNRKTIAQLQKQQQAKETKIKNLETEKNKKELILKRKMEEVHLPNFASCMAAKMLLCVLGSVVE